MPRREKSLIEAKDLLVRLSPFGNMGLAAMLKGTLSTPTDVKKEHAPLRPNSSRRHEFRDSGIFLRSAEPSPGFPHLECVDNSLKIDSEAPLEPDVS